MGWRKLGDDCEEFCRVLDDLVGCVDALRDAVRRGKRVDGEGDTKMNWNEVWCPELDRSSSLPSSPDKTNSKLEGAKSALGRMKPVKKMLGSLLSSLDDTISTITNLIAPECRAVGLASLPDDVLADILEFCHLTSDEEEESPALYYSQSLCTDLPRSAGILSSVSKCFRHVALGLPLLWKDVSFMTPPTRFSAHAYRCNRLCVYFGSGYGTANSELVEQIHPFRDWEELHFLYGNIKEGNEMFQGLMHQITEGTSFDSLKRLSIFGAKDLGDYYSEQASEDRLGALTRILASWSFASLTHIHLTNTLPSEPIQCPSATHVELVFKSFDDCYSICNLVHLRVFLPSLPKLTSLSIRFDGDVQTRFEKSLGDNASTVSPMALSCLTSLDISLNGCPPLMVISQFMDQIDTQRLTKLRVSINNCKRPPDGYNLLQYWKRKSLSIKWEYALFALFMDDDYTRPFYAVSNFSLDIVTEPELSQSSFVLMFKALPNVQHLSLKLPDLLEIDLLYWAETFRGLGELRSVRIIDQPPYWLHQIEELRKRAAAKYATFFERFSNAAAKEFIATDRWKKFEKLEIVKSSNKMLEKELLEKYVGDKLVWIASDR